ncbi:MAG: box helicase domain protein [Ilumatobacteraceae bacterium]|nr:box helicase domain protein [Ilumatobacteraceae bacterium]
MNTTTPSSGAPRRNPRRRRPAGAPTNGNTSGINGSQNHRQHDSAAARSTPDAIDLSPSVAPVVDAADFAELNVPAPIIAALTRDGITAPFPIQTATLPDSLAGRDVLGRGKTGSGKTIAFAIPTVVRLANSGAKRETKKPRALILVPTRELANQVAETLTPIAAAMNQKVAVVFGGVGQGPQVTALRLGVDILVACPGRLEDLIAQRHCRLDLVEVTVLDEADHMADLGFLPAVKRLLDQTPANAQRLLFSATLDNGIDVLVKRYLTNPVVHSVDPAIAPVSTMTHHVFAVSIADKPTVIKELAQGMDRSLLFTRTKHGAKKLAKQLSMAGIPAVEMHGNLSQNARERNLESFSEGTTRVLVATDIAARGIHVDDIALVIHVDPPAEHKAYLHRSGRTARAGAEGIVVTLMTPEQVGDVKALARAAKIDPTITRIAPGHAMLNHLVGPAAPLQRYAAPIETPQGPGRSAGGHRGAGQARSTARPGASRQPSGRRGTSHRSR